MPRPSTAAIWRRFSPGVRWSKPWKRAANNQVIRWVFLPSTPGSVYNSSAALRGTLPAPRTKERRWNVILSGLLIGVLAVVVIFTSRANFLSPAAVVVVAAIGLVALMLQLRFRYRGFPGVQAPTWLNVLGTICAIVAFFGDVLRVRGGIAEVIALIAIGCFAVSGGMVLHGLRKQRVSPK